ncbi:NAD-dependent epimerase/dehydratase family protein [Candidatus Bathyarchaeota archaeon]|nr:MAG: NAD-dependent epimerase/dehydratase family protein [Candidatus Bathyarchaeota archaeon]
MGDLQGFHLVTGGAGFIGSHLVDALMRRGVRVRVLDNLTSGRLENLRGWMSDPRFEFVEGDLLDPEEVRRVVEGSEVVYHLAANPEIRISYARPEAHFKQNIVATYNLLEAVRLSRGVKALVFTSSSTVYGEAETLPTPEDYAPLKPISIYGASKLASEALISAYAHLYGFRAVIYRLANVVGPRSHHGVVHDFIEKLRRNPGELEILGDGTQSKSYLYVEDCVEGMLLGLERSEGRVEIFNIGSEDRVDVRTIAEMVVEEMGLRDVQFCFTGGVEGGRGWKGDVKYMALDTRRLRNLGWRPRYNSREAIRETIRALLREPTP